MRALGRRVFEDGVGGVTLIRMVTGGRIGQPVSAFLPPGMELEEARMHALLPRGWHIVSHRPDGRSEHYTPEMLDSASIVRLTSAKADEVQDVADRLALQLRSQVDVFFDGRLTARSTGRWAALTL